ncbi:unnamed protein product [Schistosoma margrebowiei]|uniref:Uncharacterized protein n=1 Tax=Schistosoma margrebowiei TaxID=48269 RepID=A0A183MQF4_9TREM|nr:unnamed protein product [Schistosoma margrebowiei]
MIYSKFSIYYTYFYLGLNQRETLDPVFVLFGILQKGVPVISRELVLTDGLDPVSPSFINRGVTTELSDVKSSQIDMDKFQKMMRRNQGELDEFNDSIPRTRPIIEKVIAELSAELKNHSVQPDQSKLSKKNIEMIKLLNLVIECRRMFHENEQGAKIFSVRYQQWNADREAKSSMLPKELSIDDFLPDQLTSFCKSSVSTCTGNFNDD